MRPVAKRFVPLPGFDALVPGYLRVGDQLFVTDGLRLFAIDLVAARVAWDHSWTRPDPVFYRVPRRARTYGRRVWCRGGAVVYVTDTDHGVAAIGFDANTGREKWRQEIQTPPPVEWTEAQPAWPGAPTEEINAFLLDDEQVVLVLARSTRRVMQWPDKPMPDLRARVDVFTLDSEDGTIRATGSVADVMVPSLEKRRLSRWLVTERRVLALEPTEGVARVRTEFPGTLCWPRERSGKVTVAWRERGGVGAATVDGANGAIEIEHRWKRKEVSALTLHPLVDATVLQINDQFVALLGADLAPRWEIRIRPYVYGVAAHEGGAVVVAASGGGGGLSIINRNDGRALTEARLSGGAWDVIAVPGTGQVAAACGDGLVQADVRGGAHEPTVTMIPGAAALIDGGRVRVALLCGDPAPGVHVIDVFETSR